MSEDIGKVEYRVRKVERYIVTRYHEGPQGRTGGCEVKGEYDSADVAFEVGYALAKSEHERLGWTLDDERIQYPQHPNDPNVSKSIITAPVNSEERSL